MSREARDLQYFAIPFRLLQNSIEQIKVKPSLLKRMTILFRGVIIVAGLGGATAVQDNLIRLIRSVDIETSDGRSIHSFVPRDLFFIDKYEIGTPPNIVGQFVTGANIPAGAYAFAFQLPIPFERIVNRDPELSLLNSNVYEGLQIRINWGDPAVDVGIPVGVGDTIVLGGEQVFISGLERTPIPMDDDADRLTPRVENVLSRKEQVVPGANQNFSFDLSENTMIDGIYIRQIDNDLRVNTIINSAMIIADNGDKVIKRLTADEIRAKMKERYTVENLDPGLLYIDFDQDGDGEQWFNTLEVNTPRLILDVNAPAVAGLITVHERKMVVPG